MDSEYFRDYSKDKDGPSRFKKDLMTYKNQALTNEHRVIIIGTTNKPENGDVKEFRSFFDKFLFFSYCDYSSRLMLWNHFLSAQLRDGLKKSDVAYLEGSAKNAKEVADQEESLRMKITLIMKRLDGE